MDSEIEIAEFGQAILSAKLPVFARNGRHIFFIVKSGVGVWNLNTGEFCRVLKAADTVNVVHNPFNKLQTYRIRNTGPISYMANGRNDDFYFSAADGNDRCSMYKVAFLKDDVVETSVIKNDLPYPLNYFALGSADLDFCAFTNEQAELFILRLKERQLKSFFAKGFHNRSQTEKKICSLCVHPYEECIATGTIYGRILLWRNFLSSDEPIVSPLMWHVLPVNALTFTPEGSFLLSGGYECVLVVWLLETGCRRYKPRLGDPIRHIVCSEDGATYCLTHVNNVCRLLSSSSNVLRTLSSLSYPHSFGIDVPKKEELIFHPQFNCTVMRGMSGHLQFISTKKKEMLYNLDITYVNYVSSINLKRRIKNIEIDLFCFDNSGHFLATVESRIEATLLPYIKLKIWRFSFTEGKNILQTSVNSPHGFDTVNAMKFFSNTEVPTLWTCGNDGLVNKWSPTDIAEGNTQAWTWRDTISYQSLIPTSLDMSSDSSVMAISFSNFVTLWKLNTKELLYKFYHFDSQDFTKELMFGDGSYDEMLFDIRQHHLNIWNVGSTQLMKSVDVDISVHAINKQLGCVALIAGNSLLIINFSGETRSVISDEALTDCLGTSFYAAFPNAREGLADIDNYNLLFLTKSSGFCTIRNKNDTGEADSQFSSKLPEESLSDLAVLIKNSHLPEIQSMENTYSLPVEMKIIAMLKDVKCLLLPNVSKMCEEFLLQLFHNYKEKCNAFSSQDEESHLEKQDENMSEKIHEVVQKKSKTEKNFNENPKKPYRLSLLKLKDIKNFL